MPRDVIRVKAGELAKPVGPYSYGTRVEGGTLLFISGAVPIDKTGKVPEAIKGDMKGQMRQVVENIKVVLKVAGASLKDVVCLRYFVTDMDAFWEIGNWRCEAYPELWGRTVGDQEAPACTLIQVARLALPDWMVEIDVVAHVK